MKARIWLVVAHVVLVTLAIICVVVLGQFNTAPTRTFKAVHDVTDVYYLVVDEDGNNRLDYLTRELDRVYTYVQAVNSNLLMLMAWHQ